MRKLVLALLVLAPCAALVFAGPLLLGHALFATGFTRAAARFLGDPGWHGYTLAREGRYAEAAEAFGDAPVNAYDRGNAYARAGFYQRALDAYDDALEADPEDEDARFNKALVAKLLDGALTRPGGTQGNANAVAMHEKKHGGQGNAEGKTNSLGVGFVGNKEGSSTSGTQGNSKVSKVGSGGAEATDSNSGKASGSAGLASGKGRTGGDLADITAQLALNQRRYSPMFVAKTIKPNVEWLQTVPDDPGSFLKLQIRAEHKRRLERQDADAGDAD